MRKTQLPLTFSLILATHSAGFAQGVRAWPDGGTGSGAVTPSPQYSVGVFPNAGSAAVVAGSPTITTDGLGNLNVSAMINGGTIASAGSITSVNIIDASPSGGTSITGGTAAGVSTTGDIFSNQTINMANMTGPHKSQGMTTTLNGIQAGGSNINVWENFDPLVILNGTMTSEINVAHSVLNIQNGASLVNAEPFEAAILNNGGTTTNSLQDYLATGSNNSGYIGLLMGYQATYINGGTLGEYRGISCGSVSNTGTILNGEHCLRNTDQNQDIVSAGSLQLGNVVNGYGNTLISVKTYGNTNTTHALTIQNSSNTRIFDLDDSGALTASGQLKVGLVGGGAASIQINGVTAGSIRFSASNQNMGGAYLLTVPSNQSDTLGLLGTAQTWTANNQFVNLTIPNGDALAMQGSMGVTGTIALSGVLDYVNTAPTIFGGFGTSPSVGFNNGSAGFGVIVGTSPGSTGTLTLPAATHVWKCDVVSQANSATENPVAVSPSPTSVVITNYVRTTGIAGNFTAGETLAVGCHGI
ncbi:MAG: hypothetical protein P4N59_13075 [Negativicutes bacterium]|nr:hypothetical protein [Negativicutes bacterium]